MSEPTSDKQVRLENSQIKQITLLSARSYSSMNFADTDILHIRDIRSKQNDHFFYGHVLWKRESRSDVRKKLMISKNSEFLAKCFVSSVGAPCLLKQHTSRYLSWT